MSKVEEIQSNIDEILEAAKNIWKLASESGLDHEFVVNQLRTLRDSKSNEMKNICGVYIKRELTTISVYNIPNLNESIRKFIENNYNNVSAAYKERILLVRGIFNALDKNDSIVKVQNDIMDKEYGIPVDSSFKTKPKGSKKKRGEANTAEEIKPLESIFGDDDFKEEPVHHVIYGDVESGKKVYLKGLSGIGKTKLSTLISQKMGLPFYRINISNSTMESDFLGEKVLEKGEVVFKYGMLPKSMGAYYEQILYRSGEEGKEVYKLTPFKRSDSIEANYDGIKAVRNITKKENIDDINTRIVAEVSRPGMLLIDEYDNGRQEYLFVLQSVLEKNGNLTIKENFGEVIEPDESFRLMATGNTFGRGDDLNLYSRQELDVSQLDRFDSYYEFGYSIREKELLSKYISEKFTKEDLNKVCKLKEDIRKMIENGDLGLVFSTRRLLSLCERASEVGFKDAFLFGYYQLLTREEKESVKEVYSDIFVQDLSKNELEDRTRELKEYYERNINLEMAGK